MWYRITLRLTNNTIRTGIRQIDDDNLYRVELTVLEAAKKAMGLHRIAALDLTELDEHHPEVQALLKKGPPVRELK